MSIHPAVQAMSPKERFDRVVELAQKAHEEYQTWLHQYGDDLPLYDVVHRYEEACKALVTELNLLIDNGVTDLLTEFLTVTYRQ